MFPCVVPQELKDLTHVECMLIARYTLMMSISTLAKGGTVLTGNAIAFHQPLQTLASVLPRRLNDTGLVFVVRGLSSEEDLVALYLLPPRSGVYGAPLFDVPCCGVLRIAPPTCRMVSPFVMPL